MKYSYNANIWCKLNGVMTLIPFNRYKNTKINNANTLHVISLTNKSTKRKLEWYVDALSDNDAIEMTKSIIDNDDNYNVKHEGYVLNIANGYKKLALKIDKERKTNK